VLALPYISPAYDIWSLGCLAYALATGQDLFAPQVVLQEQQHEQQPQKQQQERAPGQPHEPEQAPLTLEERHLVDMLALLGRPPPPMVAASPLRHALYRPSGRLRAEARYRVERESLEGILEQEHGLAADEVRRAAAAAAAGCRIFAAPAARRRQLAEPGAPWPRPPAGRRPGDVPARRARVRPRAAADRAAAAGAPLPAGGRGGAAAGLTSLACLCK
jgi:hypothetical protein